MYLGGFINVDLSANPTTVNTISQYSFILYPTSRVLNSDSIELIFPSQVLVQNGIRICTASSATDQTLTIKSCTSDSNKIIAKIQSSLITTSDYAIKLQILDGIKNPQSAYSSSFKIYTYDSNSNVKDYNSSLKITYTPGLLNSIKDIIFVDIIMESSSNISGDLSSLTIKFTPSLPILMGGLINLSLECFNQNSGAGSNCITLYPGDPQTTITIISGISQNAKMSLITQNNFIISEIFPTANSDTSTEINFKINNILNPPSTAPFYAYEISTTDAGFNKIESSKTLSLQVLEPAAINTFSISSSNTTVNQMTSLSFVFMTSQFIPKGALLELIFPDDLSISMINLTSVNGISKIQPVVNYTIDDTKILMSNAISIYYTNSDIHYFKVSSIQNPSSTKPTGNFKFNIYTPDNYLMYSLKFPVIYQASPGLFSNILLKQENQEINLLAKYQFSFSNNDEILPNSYLRITFPEELHVNNLLRSPCTGLISGILLNAECEIASNSLLTIYGGFPNGLQSKTTISFVVDNIKNYFCVKSSSSFIIATYTSSNYSIDLTNDNIIATFVEGSLIDPVINRDSVVNSSISNYSISFKNKNELPINSKIIVSLPLSNDIYISDIDNLKKQCEVFIGSQKYNSNICSVNKESDIEVVTIQNMNMTYPILTNTKFIIKLPFIKNPRSLKPTSSFTLKTATSNGCIIDKNYTNLLITNIDLAETKKIEIQPASLITGAITNYEFIIEPGTEILTGDILEILFPNQIKFSASNNISIVGILNLMTNLKNTISTNSEGILMVRITMSIPQICNCVKSPDKISFQIQNIKNPISLKPTDVFSFTLRSAELFEIEKYQSNVPIQTEMKTPNQLLETYIKAGNNQKNSITDYTVQIMPFNVIPKSGVIGVRYPSQLSVVDGSCVPLIGISNINCINNASNNEIIIMGAFEEEDYQPSLIQFKNKRIRK